VNIILADFRGFSSKWFVEYYIDRRGADGKLSTILLAAAPVPESCRVSTIKPDWHSHGRKGLNMRKRLAIVFTSFVVLVGASSFLSACNTVNGAGKDVTATGHEISEEAKEHK